MMTLHLGRYYTARHTRNTGIRAAGGDHIVPLDADDLLEPAYISECMAVLAEHPDAAFVYTDYRVLGDVRYRQHLNDYNLFELLDRNTLTYAALIRKADWSLAGGYDENMRWGYEDWDLWLRLAEHDRFGVHLPEVLLSTADMGSPYSQRRKHATRSCGRRSVRAPASLLAGARDQIKARWAPAVCLIAEEHYSEQTIYDIASGSGCWMRGHAMRSSLSSTESRITAL